MTEPVTDTDGPPGPIVEQLLDDVAERRRTLDDAAALALQAYTARGMHITPSGARSMVDPQAARERQR